MFLHDEYEDPIPVQKWMEKIVLPVLDSELPQSGLTSVEIGPVHRQQRE